jgi:glycosyltransferase involved in cell wall biosynthesis
MDKMRFHVIGISHAKTTKEYSADAFTQKVRLICKMLTEAGHEVYHYGTEGSTPICTEHIDVLSKDIFDRIHGAYDWKKSAFLTDSDNPANVEFIKNAIIEVNKRRQPHDFLLCSFGYQHKPIADAVKDMIVVELGIGYRWSFAPHRIFESYSWMHFIYGTEGRDLNPNFYDAVIPNYYDLDDYIYSDQKEDYYFFIARPTILKGLEIAAKSVEAVNGRLVVAGQGEPPVKSPVIDFVGVVSIEERAKWLSKAKASFVPTYYIEPFGGTVVESLLCGTPVIATDFGAFPETVVHGKVGYRARTLEQFIWATKNIGNIKPAECRRWAEENYKLERVREMYEEYFDMLHKLYTDSTGWYQRNPDRTNLDWLIKKY